MSPLHRMVMLEDLQVARRHLSQCFPPEQNIFQWSLAVYHEAVTRRLLGLTQAGLEGNEIVSLLQWILHVYHGEDLLGSDQLEIQRDLLPSILSEDEMDGLVQSYLSNMKCNYHTWMVNTIKQEQEDWQAEIDPELDMDGCYYTSTPVLLNRMVEDNILVSSTISDTLIEKTFSISIEQLLVFGQMYRQTSQEFREGRQAIKRDVTTANNCGKLLALTEVGEVTGRANVTLVL